MKTSDLLEKNIFKHPVENISNIEYFDFLKKLFDEIYKELQSFSRQVLPNDILGQRVVGMIPQIQFNCSAILRTLQCHYMGHVSKAYRIFERCLNRNSNYVKQLCSIPQNPGASTIESLYRFRCDLRNGLGFFVYRVKKILAHSCKGCFSHDQMFHIPFDLRNIVPTYRYSIPGVPCLYLAKSLYTCWNELNRPPIQKVEATKINIKKPICFFNLAYNHQNMKQNALLLEHPANNYRNAPLMDFVEAWIVLFPFILACSIRTRKYRGSANFIHEYIIPQMLMQYISISKEIDGVRYLSTKNISCNGGDAIRPFVCFAIPAKSNALVGFDANLKQKIELTDGVLAPINIGDCLRSSNKLDANNNLWQKWEEKISSFSFKSVI